MAQQRITRREKRILSGLRGRSLVFLGMMGCGKSAIGKMVSRKLALPFMDADSEIEEAAGRSVADIFHEYGEAEFRDLEMRVIRRILENGPVALALGGGAFMRDETRQIVAQNAVSIWLKADLEVLVERVKRKPDKRPLLAKGNVSTLLSDLLAEREPVYAQADIHAVSQAGVRSKTRENVLTALSDYFNVQLVNAESGIQEDAPQ